MTQGNGEGHEDELGPASGHWSPTKADDPDATVADGPEGAGDEAPRTPPPSDEQPVMVVGVDDSDEDAPALAAGLVVGVEDSEEDAPALRQQGDEVLPRPDLPTQGTDKLGRAYASLELRTPPEELDAFARARVEALARAGQADRAGLSADALRLAQSALRRAMGALPREAP